MGGTGVARYFARHGGRGVARVVLVGTITPCLMKRPDNVDGIDPATLAAGADLLARDFPAWIAANTKPFFTPETSVAMVTWGQAMMMSTSLLAAAQLAQPNFTTDFRSDGRHINVPTRSAERRVGKGWVSTCRSGGAQKHTTTTTKHQ